MQPFILKENIRERIIFDNFEDSMLKSLYIDVEWTIVKEENMQGANRRSKSINQF